MAEPTAPESIAPSDPSSPPARTRSSREHRPRATCAMCGGEYQRLGRHVRSAHGLSMAQYARVYGVQEPARAPSEPRQGDSSTASGLPGTVVRQLADELTANPDIVARLADDVGRYMLGSGLRSSLSLSLAALLQTRMRLAGEAAAQLARLDAELAQPWRLEAGGEGGAPTPTRDLVAMREAAAAELRASTDATLKAMRLSIDERRGERGEAQGDAPLDAYRGERDALPLPADVGPQERAIMLELMRRLGDAARAEAARDRREAAAPPLALPQAQPDTPSTPGGMSPRD